MKKGLFILAVTIIAFSSFTEAQVKKGATLLGGNIGGAGMKTKSGNVDISSDRNLGISLVYGKAIKENLVFGVLASWSDRKEKGLNTNITYAAKSSGGGVFLRKYKQIASSSFAVFAQGSLGYSYTSIENHYGPITQDNKIHNVGFRAYPGVSYAVSKKLQLEAGLSNFVELSYETGKANTGLATDKERKTDSFVFSSSIDNLSSFYFGFRILLN